MFNSVDVSLADLSLVNGAKDCIYFSGNSLGLQPKNVKKYLEEELDTWAKMYVNAYIWYLTKGWGTVACIDVFFYSAIHGHTMGARPWAWAENNIEELMAKVVGKKHWRLAGPSKVGQDFWRTRCFPKLQILAHLN